MALDFITSDQFKDLSLDEFTIDAIAAESVQTLLALSWLKILTQPGTQLYYNTNGIKEVLSPLTFDNNDIVP